MDRRPLDLRGSWVLIPIAHAVVAVPFVVRAVLPTLRSIDPRLRDAAATLGASPSRVWREIDLPFLRRALVAGAGFAFAISLGEFGATSFLTRVGDQTMPIAIARLLGRPSAAEPRPGLRPRHRPDGPDPRRHPRRRSPPRRGGDVLTMLTVEDVRVRFGDRWVLDGADLTVGAGEIVGPPRAERLGQEHAAAGHRRAPPAGRRPRAVGRRGHHRGARPPAAVRAGLPGPPAVPPP